MGVSAMGLVPVGSAVEQGMSMLVFIVDLMIILVVILFGITMTQLVLEPSAVQAIPLQSRKVSVQEAGLYPLQNK